MHTDRDSECSFLVPSALIAPPPHFSLTGLLKTMVTLFYTWPIVKPKKAFAPKITALSALVFDYNTYGMI